MTSQTEKFNEYNTMTLFVLGRLKNPQNKIKYNQDFLARGLLLTRKLLTEPRVPIV